MKKNLADFDRYLDGWYVVKCIAAGKCLGCGQAIPSPVLGGFLTASFKDWEEQQQKRRWLLQHWNPRAAAAAATST